MIRKFAEGMIAMDLQEQLKREMIKQLGVDGIINTLRDYEKYTKATEKGPVFLPNKPIYRRAYLTYHPERPEQNQIEHTYIDLRFMDLLDALEEELNEQRIIKGNQDFES